MTPEALSSLQHRVTKQSAVPPSEEEAEMKTVTLNSEGVTMGTGDGGPRGTKLQKADGESVLSKCNYGRE